MTRTVRELNWALSSVLLALAVSGCGSDGGGGGDPPGGDGDAGQTGPMGDGDGDTTGSDLLASCPKSSSLIETTDWVTCLEGKVLKGVEPFSKESCELRIGKDGAMDYVLGGRVLIGMTGRSTWGPNASGTYQNNDEGLSRFFLASAAPNLAAVEGEARITRVNLSLFELEGKDDKVEVTYLDESLANRTYNCTVQAL